MVSAANLSLCQMLSLTELRSFSYAKKYNIIQYIVHSLCQFYSVLCLFNEPVITQGLFFPLSELFFFSLVVRVKEREKERKSSMNIN